jgi:hypothetical protein
VPFSGSFAKEGHGVRIPNQPDFELDDLPVDVFDLDGSGLTIESLTAGHGMAELGASCSSPSLCAPCLCICSSLPE